MTLVVVSTVLARRSISRLGLRPTLVAGLLSLAAGQFGFSRLTETTTYAVGVLPPLLLTAVGLGLALPAATVGVTRGISSSQEGLAGGLIPTAQQIGAAVLLAVLVPVAQAVTVHEDGALVAGYRTAYLVAAVSLTFAAATTAVLARIPRRQPAANDPRGRSLAKHRPGPPASW